MTKKHSLVEVDLFKTKNPIQVTAYCVELKTIVKESEYKISGILILFFCISFWFFLRVDFAIDPGLRDPLSHRKLRLLTLDNG